MTKGRLAFLIEQIIEFLTLFSQCVKMRTLIYFPKCLATCKRKISNHTLTSVVSSSCHTAATFVPFILISALDLFYLPPDLERLDVYLLQPPAGLCNILSDFFDAGPDVSQTLVNCRFYFSSPKLEFC